jgi:hypothetical protein
MNETPSWNEQTSSHIFNSVCIYCLRTNWLITCLLKYCCLSPSCAVLNSSTTVTQFCIYITPCVSLHHPTDHVSHTLWMETKQTFSLLKYFMFVKNFRSCSKHDSPLWVVVKNSVRWLNWEYKYKVNSLQFQKDTDTMKMPTPCTAHMMWGDF